VQFSIQLGVLGIVGCRDNDARRFARVRKHYYSRNYGEKRRNFFSKRQASIGSKLLNYFGFEGGTCSQCPQNGSAPALDNFDSTHGSLSTAASDF